MLPDLFRPAETRSGLAGQAGPELRSAGPGSLCVASPRSRLPQRRPACPRRAAPPPRGSAGSRPGGTTPDGRETSWPVSAGFSRWLPDSAGSAEIAPAGSGSMLHRAGWLRSGPGRVRERRGPRGERGRHPARKPTRQPRPRPGNRRTTRQHSQLTCPTRSRRHKPPSAAAACPAKVLLSDQPLSGYRYSSKTQRVGDPVKSPARMLNTRCGRTPIVAF
jgi:hypothetical protein